MTGTTARGLTRGCQPQLAQIGVRALLLLSLSLALGTGWATAARGQYVRLVKSKPPDSLEASVKEALCRMPFGPAKASQALISASSLPPVRDFRRVEDLSENLLGYNWKLPTRGDAWTWVPPVFGDGCVVLEHPEAGTVTFTWVAEEKARAGGKRARYSQEWTKPYRLEANGGDAPGQTCTYYAGARSWAESAGGEPRTSWYKELQRVPASRPEEALETYRKRSVSATPPSPGGTGSFLLVTEARFECLLAEPYLQRRKVDLAEFAGALAAAATGPSEDLPKRLREDPVIGPSIREFLEWAATLDRERATNDVGSLWRLTTDRDASQLKVTLEEAVH